MLDAVQDDEGNIIFKKHHLFLPVAVSIGVLILACLTFLAFKNDAPIIITAFTVIFLLIPLWGLYYVKVSESFQFCIDLKTLRISKRTIGFKSRKTIPFSKLTLSYMGDAEIGDIIADSRIIPWRAMGGLFQGNYNSYCVVLKGVGAFHFVVFEDENFELVREICHRFSAATGIPRET